jgi:hypothetical protein
MGEAYEGLQPFGHAFDHCRYRETFDGLLLELLFFPQKIRAGLPEPRHFGHGWGY